LSDVPDDIYRCANIERDRNIGACLPIFAFDVINFFCDAAGSTPQHHNVVSSGSLFALILLRGNTAKKT